MDETHSLSRNEMVVTNGEYGFVMLVRDNQVWHQTWKLDELIEERKATMTVEFYEQLYATHNKHD